MNTDFITENKLWLAPLAGYTDAPFRYIAKLCGADVLVSEMVSADGVKKNFEKMAHYTAFEEFERPFGIQLFGDSPQVMSRAAQILSKLKPDFFDINMGCPVKKVVKRYAGSALMLKPDLAEEIIKQCVLVLNDLGIPLTVKIRAGWDNDHKNCVPFAQMCQTAGVSAICVHPRTRQQLFTGVSDWDIIRQVKEAVQIPVIGNGDILCAADVQKMY
ncbi:MAG: tRNA-dihydrouridine synthase family protein, partial [Candidatus Cloacimonetes bacterium]|nr:tRNA-dihydrouridine synthase family protein [Candidatus Cloacimonadota bacterium]